MLLLNKLKKLGGVPTDFKPAEKRSRNLQVVVFHEKRG